MLHNLFLNSDNRHTCSVCGLTWKAAPASECVGMPVYDWGDWGDLKTKAQLYEAGYQTGAQLPKPAGCCFRAKSPQGKMWLYDTRDAVRRAPASDAQKEALAKAQHQAQIVGLRCIHCHRDIDDTLTRKQAEQRTGEMCEHCEDRRRSITGARELLAQPESLRILDTETTGLRFAEIVEIAVIDGYGQPLLNTRVKASDEALTAMYQNGAYNVHGISREMVADAPTWAEVYPKLRRVLNGKTLVVYNLSFDLPIIERLSEGLPAIELKDSTCAMEDYAAFCGQIRWERGYRGRSEWSYRWQPLDGGHNALGDCVSCLNVLKKMAGSKEFDR